jgi:hypothetical protein
MIEKNVLIGLVDKFLDSGCSAVNNENEKLNFKSYFKKDENNCFNIIDKECTIKCMFDKNFLKDYLRAYPSYIKIDNFDGKLFKIKIIFLGSLVLIKKSYFDICFFKNVNKTISVRVILFIQDFEVDTTQKIQKESASVVTKNVNLVPKIASKLNDFFYKYIREVEYFFNKCII